MGSYDGAEVCELVGLFLLNKVKSECKEVELGLYRDDGLGITRGLSGPQTERIRKKLISIFKSNGLKITIDCNLHQVNFLDVTINLKTNKYWPYRKPNDVPLYIHKESNHPPTITKQLPIMIENRISAISCDETEFNKVKEEYNDALKRSGYDHTIRFAKNQRPKYRRKRQVIWFNPPYNAKVSTNIGKAFLQLLNKHFPPTHKYHKIFNRNNVKLSYSCPPNMQSIIYSHNRQVLSKLPQSSVSKDQTESTSTTEEQRLCNCKKPADCPMSGNCLKSAVIYKATVRAEDEAKFYIGATEQTFKKRYPKHKDSIEKEKHKSSTSLSKHVWERKKNGTDFTIKWEILKECLPYRCGTRSCNLCLTEKYLILMADPKLCINKNSDLMQKCRHSNKFKLANVDERCLSTREVGDG